MNADPDVPTPDEIPAVPPSQPDEPAATTTPADPALAPGAPAAGGAGDAPTSGGGAGDAPATGGGMRWVGIVAGVVIVLLLVVGLMRGCSGGSGGSSEVASDLTPTAPAVETPTIEAAVTEESMATVTATASATMAATAAASAAATGTAPAASLQLVISAPASGTVGTPVRFSAVAAGAGNPISVYRWDFGDGGRADGPQVDYVFDLAGSYLVVLTAVDSAGQWGRAQHRITIAAAPQRPPSAVISGPTSARAGTELTFDGSASTQGDAAISTYAWAFGDGGTANGARVTHTFAQPGTYHVRLTVTDTNNLADSATQVVQISLPDPPRAVISAPSQARIGEIVTFDGSGSTSGSPIDRYAWTFGDGGTANGARVTYAYGQAGSFNVVLTVTDRSGAQSSANHRIEIQPDPARPPTAALTGPDEAQVGTPVTFRADGSSPGSSAVVRHDWFVNGVQVPGAQANTLTYTFASPGDYVVNVVLTDENGLSDAASHAIAILPDFSSMVWLLEGSVPPITLTAGEGTASGSAGCNTYQASYTAIGDATGGTLAVSGITTTQRACADETMQAEQAYLDALEKATGYVITGNRLILSSPAGDLSFVLQPESLP